VHSDPETPEERYVRMDRKNAEWHKRIEDNIERLKAHGTTATIRDEDVLSEAGQLYGSENPEYNHALVELANRLLGRTSDDLECTRSEIAARVA
jgi:hypothetical protein